jgi:broad specificity phosphatase PhoE
MNLPMRRPVHVYLARHGETDWNAQQRWQGHTDVPLNDRGREQARAIAAALRAAGIARIAASDLARAHETARIVAGELGLAVTHVDRDLRERAFGVFEGLTREECEAQQPEAWRAWLEERRTPAGAETQEMLAARVTAAIARVARDAALAGSCALVVTHGGALRAAVAAATGTMPPFVANGGLWKLAWDDGVVSAEPVEKGEPAR